MYEQYGWPIGGCFITDNINNGFLDLIGYFKERGRNTKKDIGSKAKSLLELHKRGPLMNGGEFPDLKMDLRYASDSIHCILECHSFIAT